MKEKQFKSNGQQTGYDSDPMTMVLRMLMKKFPDLNKMKKSS